MENNRFLIVNTKALPDIFTKVVEAKKLMESGKVKHVQDAVNIVGISRSVFYKYRDFVFPYSNNKKGKTSTIAMNLVDVPGLLSNILNLIAESGSNVLTINQTIPINSVANVTITIETYNNDMQIVFDKIRDLEGLQSFKILNEE